MPEPKTDENGFFVPEPGKPGFPVNAEFDRKHALMTAEELESLPECTYELPAVVPTYSWKTRVMGDDGKSRWIIGRYEPVKGEDGVVRKCRVILRELLLTENGSSRQDDDCDGLGDEAERYYGYWC